MVHLISRNLSKISERTNSQHGNLFRTENTMPSLASVKKVDLKTQKRRRRSLDESLINPFKAFVVSARLRRQSTTDATNFERGSIFYSSDKRRRRSENEYFSKLPIQDATKERLISAVARSSSFQDNNESNTKHTPKMLRRLSRHLARKSFSEYEDQSRHQILKNKNSKDVDETSTATTIGTPNSFRSVRKQFDRMSFDASSLSTIDSGIDTRYDKNSSDENDRSEDGDSLRGVTRDTVLSTSGAPLVPNRSLSVNDVAEGNDSNEENCIPLVRQYSLRGERSSVTPMDVSPSAIVLRQSKEKFNSSPNDCSSHVTSNIDDEKTEIADINNTTRKGSIRKKKKILPFVNRIRKSSRNNSFEVPCPLTAPPPVTLPPASTTSSILLKDETIDSVYIEKIVTEIVQDKAKGLEYDHSLSKERCRMISTTIEQTLKLQLMSQSGNPEYKIAALVYIGEAKEKGIFFATQCSYHPTSDLFATVTFQNNEMYICTTVLATLLSQTA